MARQNEERSGELLARIAEGDVVALRRLYEAHSPWLRLRLSKRCADPDLVDQAIQDTFVAAWEKAGGYQGSGEVGAWLWGIAIRRLIDLLRRRR
ncbi:MAG TPA: sigma factor, partial [Acidimicrobiia bacterium]|nr:sigma factor [Acidimicrobiia bacterium]